MSEQSTIEVPVLRNDESTLKDRMTENAYDSILPARYLKKNEDGEVIEEQEELFERVAKNIAIPEALHHENAPKVLGIEHTHEHFDIEEFEEYLTEDGYLEFREETARYISYDNVFDHLNQEYPEVADVMKQRKDEFQDLMEHLNLMPNTPCLINAGRELQQLSACFVLDIDDDMRDIHEVAADAAEIFQSGGGLGYPFSFLRPYGDKVGSTGGVASGPISFMNTLDQVCNTVAQGGVRRGAQMGVMDISHPDIPFFIHAKNTDVSLAQTLLLNDPDDFTHDSFGEALEEAQGLIDEEGRVPEHLRNAAEGHLSNFNISVGVTDDFMNALQNGEDYTLINPRTEQPYIASEETKELYSWFDMGEYVEVGEELSVPAQELWDRIIDGAHSNGEPGVIYIDRVNEHNTFDHEEYPEYKINSTNPCVTEGTLVNTPFGPERVEEINEGELINTVWGSEVVDEVKTYTDEDIYRVKFSDGGEMKVTENHRFHVKNTDKSVSDVPLKNIEEGDVIRVHTNSLEEQGDGEEYERWLKRGILLGDGGYTKKTLQSGNVLKISTNEDDVRYNKRLKKLFGSHNFNIDGDYSDDKALNLNVSGGRELVDELDLSSEKSINKSFDVTEIENEAQAMGILDGLLATDGNVNNRDHFPQIRWFTASRELAHNIRDTLISLGFHGRISVDETKNRGGNIDGRQIKENAPKYTVSVSGNSLLKYCEKSDLHTLHPSKGEEMMNMMETKMLTGNTYKATIEDIEYIGEADVVYDLYCKGSDTWITYGYVQRGCGEEPLFDGDACNLTHINLSTIADENSHNWSRFTKSGSSALEENVSDFLEQAIDWNEFNHRIDTGVNFLDNVVTMSDFPIENIDETVQSSRKIGLGIMGLAQLYIQIGIEYGSEESQEIARQLMKHIHHRSKEKSRQLAEDRGSFDDWGKSKWADPQSYPDFFEHHTGEHPDGWVDGYPQRNHETTTIAPTGTTSQIGDTSGGCEPIFSVCYYKNVTDDIQGDEMLVEFDGLFLKTLEENGVDVEKAKKEAIELMESNEFDGPSSIPSVPIEIGDLFVTTNQLSAKEHASVQCALQEGVGSGISKTVNAPNDSTLEDAKEAFEFIYENGGKSVTYYRDGSRTKQVQTTRKDNQGVDKENESESSQKDYEVPFHRDAPDVLTNVERHRIQTGHGKLYVTIGEDEHGVVEVMATVGKSGGSTEAFTEALARQISQSLQWGVPVEEVVDQLQNIKGPDIGYDGQDIVHSVPDGIALALKRYTEEEDMMNHPTVDVSTDNEYTTDASECPECGAMALVEQEGCNTCLPEMGGCAYSKCS